MIKVSVEVHEGDAPFVVSVQAESICLAVSTIEERHPGGDVRVVFPIDPEGFFPGKSEKTGGGIAPMQTATALHGSSPRP